jgi:hypothetical protein
VQERAGNTLELIGIGNDFLNKIQMAQQLREWIEKLVYDKLKRFCPTKETVSTLKRLPTEWGEVISSCSSDKGLITRIYKKLKKVNSPKFNDPMKKWAKELNRTLLKEDAQMAKTHSKKCPHHPWPSRKCNLNPC